MSHICNIKFYSSYIKEVQRNWWISFSNIFYLTLDVQNTLENVAYIKIFIFSDFLLSPGNVVSILYSQYISDKVTTQVLKSHLWLVTTILESTAIDAAAALWGRFTFVSSRPFIKGKIKLGVFIFYLPLFLSLSLLGS